MHPDTLRIVSVIFFLAFLGIGLKRPVWATVAYMILVYCKLSAYYPIFATIKAELILGILILIRVIFLPSLKNKLSIKYNKTNKYLGIFTLCIFLSFLFAIDKQYSWDNAVYHFIKVLLLYVLIILSINSERDLKIFIWSLIVMFAYLAYEPTYGFLTGTDADIQMYGDIYTSDLGILTGHVALANNMNQMIPIAFFLIPTVKRKKLRIFACCTLIIYFLALIGSGSRGGVAGFFAFGLMLIYFSKNRLRNAMLVSLTLLILFGFSERMKSTTSRITEGSIKARLSGFIHGIEMVRLKGHFVGVGPGCFILARGRYFSYTMQSHNIYGEVIGDLGIPGTVAWFFFIRQIFVSLMLAKRRLKSLSTKNDFLYNLAIGFQISLILRLFISLASHGLYYFYWYVMAALSFHILRLTDEKNIEGLTNKTD